MRYKNQSQSRFTKVFSVLTGAMVLTGSLTVSALAQQQDSRSSSAQQEVISPSQQPESSQVSEPEVSSPAPEQPDNPQAPDLEESTPNPETASPNQAAPDPEMNSASSTADDVEQQKLVEEGLADESEQIPETIAPEETIAPTSEVLHSTFASKGVQALKEANKEHGYVEGKGNANKFSAYFGVPRTAWCAAFVSRMFDEKPVGDGNKKLPWTNPLRVVSILEWGRRTNNVVKQPQPGDLFIMQARGRSHVGFVKSVKGNIFKTMEGNTTKPGNPRVEGVFSHSRDLRKFPYVFVRVPDRTRT